MNKDFTSTAIKVLEMLFVAVLFHLFVTKLFGCNVEHYPVTEYKPGAERVVKITDTIFVDRIKLLKAKGTVIPQDSTNAYSFIDTTVVSDSALIGLSITTFPAVDSLQFSIQAEVPIRELTILDSIFITRVDTLKITLQEIEEQPFYKSFEAGAIATTLLGGIIYLLSIN